MDMKPDRKPSLRMSMEAFRTRPSNNVSGRNSYNAFEPYSDSEETAGKPDHFDRKPSLRARPSNDVRDRNSYITFEPSPDSDEAAGKPDRFERKPSCRKSIDLRARPGIDVRDRNASYAAFEPSPDGGEAAGMPDRTSLRRSSAVHKADDCDEDGRISRTGTPPHVYQLDSRCNSMHFAHAQISRRPSRQANLRQTRLGILVEVECAEHAFKLF